MISAGSASSTSASRILDLCQQPYLIVLCQILFYINLHNYNNSTITVNLRSRVPCTVIREQMTFQGIFDLKCISSHDMEVILSQ